MNFRDIYQGGACNVGDQSNASNPFTQFLDNLVLGKAQQQQMINQMGAQQNQNVNQQIQQREQDFRLMNQAWGQIQSQMEQLSLMEKQKMEQAFMNSQMEHEQQMQFQEMMMQQQWKEAELQHEADQLAQEFKFNEAFDNAEEQMAEDLQKKIVKDAATDMMQMMMNDPDPKFQQSKFLGFLQQINHGNLTIVNKQLLDKNNQPIVTPALEVQYDSLKMDNAWTQAEEEQKNQAQQLDPSVFQDAWNKNLQDYENLRSDDQTFEKMLEEQYKKILEDMEKGGDVEGMMAKAWQGASDLQEQTLYKDSSDVYRFAENNPFMNEEFPLDLAMKLSAQGQTSTSILALEAHIQRNLGDSQAWRIMGRLHQENDQDQKAVSCFLNALKNEPNNLDTLLALGISCTNILDEVKAMSFLKQWMMKNPKYNAAIEVDPTIVPDDQSIYDFSMEQIKQMSFRMLGLYEDAMKVDPNDPDLMNGLAVLFFINRQYERSVELFKRALQIEPKNYSLWNKLGATLAHLNEPDQAVFCYHRALDLRPNFVRVWVNLGIAAAHKSDYHEAARLYLSALNLNPQAQHIWGYLQTCFMCMKRADLIQKIAQYDPKVFLNEFDITSFQDLPNPEIYYGDANQEFIYKFDTQSWVNEFHQQQQQK